MPGWNSIALTVWLLLAVCLLPLALAALAKWGGGFKPADNAHPRQFLAGLSGWPARAQAAQLNSYEGLPLLVGAVVMAQTLAVRQLVINEFLLLYLLLRLAYTGAYLANWPAVRSVLWLLGTLCPVVLLVLAAKGL
jgi:uncharacterized MAPEG superfamily protein